MAKASIKVKAQALPVPQTMAGAVALAAELAAVQREAELLSLAQDESLARIKAEAEAAINPLVMRANDMASALLAYAESNRVGLFAASRNAQIGAAELALRWGGPTVTVARGVKESSMVATLKGLGLERLVRVEEAVNKQAILANPDLVENVAGVTITQTERLTMKLEGVAKPIQAEFQRVTGSAARHQAEE